MTDVSTVLIAARDPAEWGSVIETLSVEYGYRVFTVRSAKEALALGEKARVDLLIGESSEGDDSSSSLCQFRLLYPDTVRLMVVDQKRGESARRAAERAAVYQILSRPLDTQQIALVVKRALEARELARRHRLLSRELRLSEESPVLHAAPLGQAANRGNSFEKLVYVSEPMAELCDLSRKAAQTSLPILIQGETGTGKELLARAIHYNSDRAKSPLLVQNCGGLPDELLQSELFGHKRGAFTGAVSDRLGLFRAADGGTVFLDEISEISPSFQVSLLRFLQEGEIKPLGSDRTLGSDVRVIAASNRPLDQMVERRQFRRDLYFRLKGFELQVPPLRDRPADIPVLAEFFTDKYSQAMGRRILGIAMDVVKQLIAYPFPGNVRELENEIRRMVALAKAGEYLTPQTLSSHIAAIRPREAPGRLAEAALDGDTLKEKVESLEKALVTDALARHRWNQSEAARELGLSRVGLANKIKRYDLKDSRLSDAS